MTKSVLLLAAVVAVSLSTFDVKAASEAGNTAVNCDSPANFDNPACKK